MQATASATRRHDIDALRVIAFGLLILYHVGMFYVADWGWHVKSSHLAEWLQWPMMAVNRWRMSLLFLLSGVAVAFLLRRRGGGSFAWSRTVRLGLPLLFGMAVVVPPQAWLQAVSNGAFAGGYGEFLQAYFSFSPWPEGAFDGSHVGVTWNHLWYLPYLLSYSLLVALALPALRSRWGSALQDRIRALRGWRLLWLPAIPLVLSAWLLTVPSTHDLVSDWENHARYFSVFLFGYWLAGDAGLWAELRRLRWASLGLAVLLLGLMFGLMLVRGAPSPAWQRAGYDLVTYGYQWMALAAVLGWGHHLLDRPFRWLPYATQAVYPCYVLHQTLIVVAGFHLSRAGLGPVLEPVLVLLATAAGCAALYELVIRRSAWLRPLFGLKRRPAEAARLVAAEGAGQAGGDRSMARCA